MHFSVLPNGIYFKNKNDGKNAATSVDPAGKWPLKHRRVVVSLLNAVIFFPIHLCKSSLPLPAATPHFFVLAMSSCTEFHFPALKATQNFPRVSQMWLVPVDTAVASHN